MIGFVKRVIYLNAIYYKLKIESGLVVGHPERDLNTPSISE